jgi:hypothetical protein
MAGPIAVATDPSSGGSFVEVSNIFGGSQYTLSGAATGVQYPGAFPDQFFFDGTSNGEYDFSVDNSTGNVWRFDSGWSNPQLMFTTPEGGWNAGGRGSDMGITYDPTNNSLWISQQGILEDFQMNGTLLSSFSVAGTGGNVPLAMDYSDDTLWVVTGNTAGLAQYSVTGSLLNAVTLPTLPGGVDVLYGAEFDYAAPEPGSVLLAILGLIAMWCLRSGVLGRAHFVGGPPKEGGAPSL